MKNLLHFFTLLLMSVFTSSLSAALTPATIFGDNGVLQRDRQVPVWGTSSPNAEITVEFGGQKVSGKADAAGKWMLYLQPMPASAEGRELTISGDGSTIVCKNILVGEVWLCGGQSNMAMPLWGNGATFRHREYDSKGNVLRTGEEEAKENGSNSLLRLARMAIHEWSAVPRTDYPVKWEPCTPESAMKFSAAGYFFGQMIQKELGIPVGLISSNWGGTGIDPWTPPEGYNSVEQLKDIAEVVNAKIEGTEASKRYKEKVIADYSKWLEEFKNSPAESRPAPPPFPVQLQHYSKYQDDPTILYNRMIYPLVPYAMRGAIWYQGEHNLFEGQLYRHKMQALLNGWRKVFNNPDLSFYFAQLAPFRYGAAAHVLPTLSEAQQDFADDNGDNVQMMITNDAVHSITDIHPADKKPVGERMAGLALKYTYGRKELNPESPRVAGYRIEGSSMVISFKYVKSWSSIAGDFSHGFRAATIDGIIHNAQVTVKGSDLVISVPGHNLPPQQVFYLWDQMQTGNLRNEHGLPLGCFRVGNPVTDPAALMQYYGKDFRTVYECDLVKLNNKHNVPVKYAVDNSASVGKFSEVLYFFHAVPGNGAPQWVVARMKAFTDDASKLGIPVQTAGIHFQCRVQDLVVSSNVEGITTGAIGEGNIEFWPNNYGGGNNAQVPGAVGSIYDFGDSPNELVSGYGSMQLHDFQHKGTVFAYNSFCSGKNADFGLGTSPGPHKDWTFSKGLNKYDSVKLVIMVR